MPLSPAAELIRANLATRCQGLAELEPAALDLAARVLEQLHAASWGRMADLRDSRTARYREMQLAGERGLPLEDICALALEGGEDVVAAAVAVIAQRLGWKVEHFGGGE